jgi:hypothetical protein
MSFNFPTPFRRPLFSDRDRRPTIFNLFTTPAFGYEGFSFSPATSARESTSTARIFSVRALFLRF